MDADTAIADQPASSAGPVWLRSDRLVPYPDAMARMRDTVARLRDGDGAETVWLLEHPPTFTAGTSARPDDLFNPLGFETFEAGRGGQWTYHGPGQLVAYVMLDLQRPHGPVPARDVRAYVRALEQWLIAALARLGVTAGRREGRVGVWVAGADGRDSKIAALGVRMTRWVSWHGVSLNIDPELGHFDGIVPCGIREHGVTSLRALGLAATRAQVETALRKSWPDCFGNAEPTSCGSSWRQSPGTS